ncbi:MAG: hypothetical protein B6229_09580, partial [Spirochaetaceae bacterium 4572_7]
MLTSIGGLYTELSGSTNIALEGYISIGAFLVIALTKITGSLTIGIILTLLLIGIISFTHSYSTIKLQANPIITGLAVNMAIFGIIPTLSFKLFKTKGVLLLERTELINTTSIIAIALLCPIFSAVFIKYTRYGLRIRARGINKKVLTYSNINNDFYRVSSMIISAIFAATAGIFLALQLRSFTPNMSSGRGWISLVIIFLGRKNPIGIFIGSVIFSIAQMLSNMIQNRGIPGDIVLAIPYIITL